MEGYLKQKIIDVIQWVLIIGLLVLVFVQCFMYKNIKKDLVTAEEYNKENTYVRIYESKKLNDLKKTNRELYDSIAKLQNVESGMIIKFKERYKTDTIFANQFILQHDTIFSYNKDTNTAQDIVSVSVDSIYHYKHDNDTVSLKIDVKAQDLKWVTADFSIKDQFMIINREKDGVNQTLIHHSDNTTIENTTMWHKKNDKKWYQKFTISPQIGVGYGLINKNFDTYVGVGVGYKF